jgi:hypothetical protein
LDYEDGGETIVVPMTAEAARKIGRDLLAEGGATEEEEER